VSTTVYRAALLAGLPFAEWHPHTFRLGFYELDGWPPGIDAAIYQPNTPDEWALDLRFTNPTNAWMLLQLSVDNEHLSAAIYGTTGYAVDLSEPDFGEQSPVPEPIERPTPDLQPGEREQVQIAQPGIDISITRWVTQGDVLISEDTFYSPYQAQADVYLVGTEGS
jgi:vancomycin resistance protein YoaR